MSRSDLLLQLVQSGSRGDKHLFKKVVEAIIAEERAKQHITLADKLQENLNVYNYTSQPKSIINGNGKSDDSKNLVFEIEPKILFDDLVLPEKVKTLFKDFVEEQLRCDLLRSYGLEPRNRIMVIGPPGNGKTSIAEAIASSLMVPFLSVRYENIIASYLGETSTRLKNLFDYVRSQRCVLFFDEFDSIGKERGDIHETGEIKRVVSTLLLQVDKLPSYVTIIAATNHPELLDRAVWRRFQIKATLIKPTLKDIIVLLEKYQKKHSIKFGHPLNSLALGLKGLSFSEIVDFCDDIIRRYILDLPGSANDLKNVTSNRLSQLKTSIKIK